jgi:predicted dehydrogenase
MIDRKITVSVVGLGVGAAHARSYARIDQCLLALLYDLDSERSEALCRELNTGRAAISEREALTDPSIDCVSIASYDDAHFAQLIAALGAGKHVFIEKPLCSTLVELKQVKQAWRRAGRPAVESNLVLRSAPLYRQLRSMMVCGDIYIMDGDYLNGRLSKITEGWRKEVENYSVMLGGS